MKKIILLVCIIVVGVLLMSKVQAFDLGKKLAGGVATNAGYTDKAETSFGEKAGAIINIVLSFLGVIFLALMVYAGSLWLTARGEEEPISKSKKIMAEAVIGFILVVGAYSITSLLVPKLLEKTTGGGGSTLGSSDSIGCCIRTFENGETYAVVVGRASDCSYAFNDSITGALCAGQGVEACEYKEVKGEGNCKL